MKVPFYDKRILRTFYAALSAISVITSILFLFIEIDAKFKAAVGVIALCVLVLLYIGLWLYSNFRQSIELKVNNSLIEVKYGDIFNESAELKAIAFNEYFDTLVDDKIISKGSLNGQFIEKYYKGKVDELDSMISSDPHLLEAKIEENVRRRSGKKVKYNLGTICVIDDYLITAFSRFDDDDRAYLGMNDYINCMLNFWNEVDRIYAGRTVALPVLGSGITRFKGYENISDQELLELIIWTFKVSRIKFSYPSKVKIVVYDKKSEKTNLVALKDLET